MDVFGTFQKSPFGFYVVLEFKINAKYLTVLVKANSASGIAVK